MKWLKIKHVVIFVSVLFCVLQILPLPDDLQKQSKRDGNDNITHQEKYETTTEVFSRWRRKEPRDQLLTVFPNGRLGNNMFQYASLLGIALKSGKRPFMTGRTVISVVFRVSFMEDIDYSDWPSIIEPHYARYCPQLEAFTNGSFVLKYSLQSWKYFEFIREDIRKEFRFTPKLEKLANITFKRYLNGYETKTKIALHVRLTDMASGSNRNMGYTTAPLSYIYKAVDHMNSKFRNTVYLVATDDVDWCKDHLNISNVVIMNTNNPWIDFATLTKCDHMIMTVGTFGWWAAWLINGETVYYRDYPRQGSSLSEHFVPEDYFLPHWIPMSD